MNNIEIIISNVGDSRALLIINNKIQIETKDHKPNDEDEEERIKKAGGFVYSNRVNGRLAVSRAFGDYEFKNNKDFKQEEQQVTAEPDIYRYKFKLSKLNKKKHSFLVLGTDGIWDDFKNEKMKDIII